MLVPADTVNKEIYMNKARCSKLKGPVNKGSIADLSTANVYCLKNNPAPGFDQKTGGASASVMKQKFHM